MGLPILWRYAIVSYLRVFALSVGTFVAVLVVLRFKEIAKFAALTANWTKAGAFTLYQIPFILPMAVPLSALIAAFLVVERMSASHELTALRAARVSLKSALAPLWIVGCFVSALNFAICSDLAPFCRRAAKALVYQTTSGNPLLILQRQTHHNVHVDFELLKEGKKVRNLVLVGYLQRHKRLSMLLASELRLRGEKLLGRGVALVSHLESETPQDSLIIENHDRMSTSAPSLTAALRKNRLHHQDVNAFSLQTLCARRHEAGTAGIKAWLELWRRCSLSLAVATFTLLGSAFAIEPARRGGRSSLLVPLTLTLLLLSSYFLAKGFKTHLVLAALAYALPHPLAWAASWWRLRRVEAGRR